LELEYCILAPLHMTSFTNISLMRLHNFSGCTRIYRTRLCRSAITRRYSGGTIFYAVRASSICALQNFLLHIRKLPHFDTRFGVAQARCGSPQKRVLYICPGRSVGAVLLRAENCSGRQFLGSKRVSKWGNFLISLIRFCKSRAGFRKMRCCANGARLRPPKYNLCARASALE